MQKNEVTFSHRYEDSHVAISVSIGDTLKRATKHICDPNPKELIQKFNEELERPGKNVRAMFRADVMRRWMVECCDQVPLLGFSCGRYALNLTKEHFAELLADTTAKVQVGKHKTMFIETNSFLFVNIINYLGPSTSYKK